MIQFKKTVYSLNIIQVIVLPFNYVQLVTCTLTIVSIFQPNSTLLTHLTVHQETSDVYVGAENCLYHLDPLLNLISSVSTVTYTTPTKSSKSKDANNKINSNINTALVIDYERDRLIACGNIHGGVCAFIPLFNFSTDSYSKYIPPTTGSQYSLTTVVAFIAPAIITSNPQIKNQVHTKENALYLGLGATFNKTITSSQITIRRLSSNRKVFSVVGHKYPSFSENSTRNKNQYLYGFSHKNFSYFLILEPQDVHDQNSPLISKLSRVCHDDPHFFSFAQIPIQCRSNDSEGQIYTIAQAASVGKASIQMNNVDNIEEGEEILFVSFAQSSTSTRLGEQKSALCLFPLKDIRRKFTENIAKCYRGEGDIGFVGQPEYRKSSPKCKAIRHMLVNDDFGGTHHNSPLKGRLPITSVVTIQLPWRVSSIAVNKDLYTRHVYLGDEDGNLNDIFVGTTRYANIVSSKEIQAKQRILTDIMTFDSNKAYLYAMTTSAVFKISLIPNCSEYSTCLQCISFKDLHCGWSFDTNSCISHDSPEADHSYYTTIHRSLKKCAIPSSTLKKIHVSNDPYEINTKIELMDFDYKESFLKDTCSLLFSNGNMFRTYGNLTREGISCFGPSSQLISIPLLEHSVAAILTVNVNLNNETRIYSRNEEVIFYDCGTFETCAACAESEFPCSWCVLAKKCKYNREECPNDITIGSNSTENLVSTNYTGKDNCPAISFLDHESLSDSNFLVPVRSSLNIKLNNVTVQKLALTSGNQQIEFNCIFKVNSKTHIIEKAERKEEFIISCEPPPRILNYQSTVNVSFGVSWKSKGIDSQELENPLGLHLIVYSCSAMAKDSCISCLNINETLNCGWCLSSKKCEVSGLCQGGRGDWLDSIENCTKVESEESTVLTLENSSEYGEAYFLIKNGIESSLSYVLLALLLTGLLAITLVAVIVVIFTKRKKSQFSEYLLSNDEVKEFRQGTLNKDSDHTENSVYDILRSLSFNKDYEIPASKLIIDHKKILGSGKFGVVFRGNYKVDASNVAPVAVKTVKSNDVLYFKALLTELKVMAYLGKHENIVALMGAQTTNIKQGQLYIALEFCGKGDLLQYLKQNRPNFHNIFAASNNSFEINDEDVDGYLTPNIPLITIQTTTTSEKYSNKIAASVYYKNQNSHSPRISAMDLIEWSRQIADGMSFISSKNVIHGDLAARNILLDANYSAKIGDFGFSRQLLNYENYMKKQETPLPWKWLAIESLKDMNFSVKSDVWAFGVTMWEIFSLGQVPYPCWNYTEEFVTWLDTGHRMSSPRFANQEIYNLMLTCWQDNPTQRFDFSNLASRLKKLLSHLDPNYQINVDHRHRV